MPNNPSRGHVNADIAHRYADLVGDGADPSFVRVVASLDRWGKAYQTAEPPLRLRAAIDTLADQHGRPVCPLPSALQHQPSASNPFRRRYLRIASAAAIGVIALILSIGLTVGMEPVDAATQHLAQRFGFVLVNSTPDTPARTGSTGTMQSTAQGGRVSLLSLAEAQSQVPFPIPQPAWLPSGLAFQGVSVGTGPAADAAHAPISVVQFYRRHPGDNGVVTIRVHQGDGAGGYEVPAGAATSVTVGQYPAVFTHGAWTSGIDSKWDPSFDQAMISWSQGGFSYVVQTSGLDLSQTDLLRVAESLP